jgi:hypothetical protein
MRLNRLASLAVVTAAAALSVHPGHAADGIAPQGAPGRGGHEIAPAALADGLATAPDGGAHGAAPSSDAVLELVSFVRAREWAIDLEFDGNRDGYAKFVVTARTSLAARSDRGGSEYHQGNGWVVLLMAGLHCPGVVAVHRRVADHTTATRMSPLCL